MEEYTLATPAPVKEPTASDPPPPNKLKRVLMIVGIIFGFALFFVLGTLMSGGRNTSQNTQVVSPTESPTPTTKPVTGSVTPPASNPSGSYLPGKEYLDDTVTIVTKTEPYRILSVGVSRLEQTRNFTQFTKVNYHTGSAWLRETVTTTVPRADILANPLLKRWQLPTVLQGNNELNGIEIMIENKPITFSATKVSPSISTQSFPGHTKFIYFGEGTLKSPDDEQPVYYLFSQTYSRNASDVSFLNAPEKLESDWYVFWDTTGTAYYADKLASPNSAKPFENYNTGVIFYPNGTFTKVSDVRIQRRQQANEYSGSIPATATANVNFALSGILNKSASRAYQWQLGVITGTVSTNGPPQNGVGVMETIHKTQ